MNDPEFKIFLNDMMTIREGGQINFNKYGKKDCRKSICWTNRTRKAINQKWNLKESQNVKYITLNNMRVYKNLPIISKKTVNVGDKDLGQQIRNNEEFEVMDFDNKTITIKSVTIKSMSYIIKIKHEEMKHFQLGYCMTVHCSQGSTFDFDYSIYEWQCFTKEMMYVAISRATKRSLINFCDTDYKLNEGFIYKITNKTTNKIYIGSTKTSIEQRFQEHLTTKDTSALHKDIQELGPENFNIELVEKIEYIDEETLLIAETTYIMAYDSINSGYNTKFSCDLTNLF
jgi:hypothetical protein